MIIGIGTDICSISRFEDEEKRGSLIARFFTENERTYVESRGKGAAASAAAVFAAKEACAKALGTGFRGFGPSEIEVVHNEDGNRLTGWSGKHHSLPTGRASTGRTCRFRTTAVRP